MGRDIGCTRDHGFACKYWLLELLVLYFTAYCVC